jgi:hypothetical protein
MRASPVGVGKITIKNVQIFVLPIHFSIHVHFNIYIIYSTLFFKNIILCEKECESREREREGKGERK